MSAGDDETADLGELPDLLGYQLRRAQVAVFQAFGDAVGDDAVTPGRFGLLNIVARNEGLSQTALARALGIDRSSMVAMIDKLEGFGWLERRRAPDDRRTHAIHLTRDGRALLDRLWPTVRAHEAEIAKRLSPQQRRTLLDLLRRIGQV